MSGSQLQTREQREITVADQLRSAGFLKQLAMAAPRGVQAERMARVAMTLWRESPSLQKCDPTSLLGAVMTCAQTGLEPGPMGHCAIVPYKGKATWQPMYKGLLHLAYRSEQISGVSTGVVYELDEFDYSEGSDAFVKHKRSFEKKRGDRVAVYASIGIKGGGNIVRVMPWHEIESIRDRYSKTSGDRSAWTTEADEMAMKTVLKRALKIAPVSVEAQAAIGMDDLAETGKEQPNAVDVTVLDKDGERSPEAEYCNRPIGTTGDLACSLASGHSGECHP